jgi:hypothetical protein
MAMGRERVAPEEGQTQPDGWEQAAAEGGVDHEYSGTLMAI